MDGGENGEWKGCATAPDHGFFRVQCEVFGHVIHEERMDRATDALERMDLAPGDGRALTTTR